VQGGLRGGGSGLAAVEGEASLRVNRDCDDLGDDPFWAGHVDGDGARGAGHLDSLEAVEANRAALAAHSAELKQADAAVKAAESAPAVSLERAGAELAAAKQRLAAEKSDSVMHRAASAWFGVTPGELSDAQFQAFARVAIGALAISISTATMLAAFVSNLPQWDGKESRLARAFRAMIAARRKTLRRIEARTVVVDRIVRVHVPTHPDTGMPLDRRAGG
jgi:hypothetical protein